MPEKFPQAKPLQSKKRSLGKSFFAVGFVLFVFGVGYFYGAWNVHKVAPDRVVEQIVRNAPEFENQQIDFTLFWEVWNEVKKSYVDQPVADEKLFYGSMEGLVNSLDDPYSTFLNPEQSKAFTDDLAGNFEGIGAEIGIRSDQLVVVSPLSGSPAEKAGLRAGDFILSIDDADTVGMSLTEAVTLIRGEQGTTVVLNIFREGESAAQDISIVRDVIHVNSVDWSYDEKTGIVTIELHQFIETTESELNAALQDILLKHPRGVVLDLRNNPGGFLTTAIRVASQFLNSGVVVSERFSDGSVRKYETIGTPSLVDMPMVVLVNEGSASASEIVAGALKDHGRAKLVGKKTFGKGSVQDFQELSDGSTLKITVAKWLTPNGAAIDGEGIAPDVEVDLTKEDIDAEKDPQADKAVEILRAAMSSDN